METILQSDDEAVTKQSMLSNPLHVHSSFRENLSLLQHLSYCIGRSYYLKPHATLLVNVGAMMLRIHLCGNGVDEGAEVNSGEYRLHV